MRNMYAQEIDNNVISQKLVNPEYVWLSRNTCTRWTVTRNL